MSNVVNMRNEPVPITDTRRKLGSTVTVMLNGRHDGMIVGRTFSTSKGPESLYDIRTAVGVILNVSEEDIYE